MTINNRFFANDSLIFILVPFIEKVEARIADLLTGDAVVSTALTGNEPTPELSDALFDGIFSDMVQQIQKTRDFAVASLRDVPSETITEFIYLLAAFVDEMLISAFNTQLPRRFNGAVEYMIFGTRDAGEQVFMRIERLLARRSQLDFSLSGAYLLVLSLGFKGQYFQQQGESVVLTQYHKDLSSLALRSCTPSPPLPSPADGVEAAGAMQSLVIHRQLTLLLCAIGLTWLSAVIGMEIFWRIETAPVRRTVTELHVPMSPTSLPGNDQ